MDLLQLPVDDRELADSLTRGLTMARHAVPAGPAAEQHGTAGGLGAPAPEADGPGRVFTISSATGGCGKTFFATNLAHFLARYTGKRVCIVDLDLQFGEVVTVLRLRPRFTIFDVLQRDDADADALTVSAVAVESCTNPAPGARLSTTTPICRYSVLVTVTAGRAACSRSARVDAAGRARATTNE